MARLDADSIAAAALAIVDEHGVSGFTIRAVADSLGVTPMALYHHVGDKAGLAALVVDLATTRHPLPLSTGVWQEDLMAIASWLRESAIRHPAVPEIQRTYRVWTESMVQIAERWVSVWQQSGLPPKLALLAATTSSMAITGLAAEEIVYRNWEPPDLKLLTRTPNARQLLTAEEDPADLYDLAARSVIDGIYARLSQGAVSPARKKPVLKTRAAKRSAKRRGTKKNIQA